MQDIAIPRDFLDSLCRGSFEERARQLQAVLEADFVEHFTYPATRLSALATFADHVVVATDAGEFRRVYYEVHEADKETLVSLRFSESIAVPLVSKEDLTTFVVEQVHLAAKERLHGHLAASDARLQAVSPFMAMATQQQETR